MASVTRVATRCPGNTGEPLVIPELGRAHNHFFSEAKLEVCGSIFLAASRTESRFTLSPNSFSRCSRRMPWKERRGSISLHSESFINEATPCGSCLFSPVLGQQGTEAEAGWLFPLRIQSLGGRSGDNLVTMSGLYRSLKS